MAKKFVEKCGAPDCTRLGDFARGLCAPHWKLFRAACIENKSWSSVGSKNPETPKPAIPPFEYAGDEQSLIERLEKAAQKGERK
jgi:hypothetical protein